MIQRIQDILPDGLLPSMLEMARWPHKWLVIEPDDDSTYLVQATRRLPDDITDYMRSVQASGRPIRAMDLCGLQGMTELLRDGPKIVRPTPEQAESLSQVDVNLTLQDFTQPFPAMVVETPGNPTYECVLVYRHSPEVLVLDAISNRKCLGHDLLGILRAGDKTIEHYLSIVLSPALLDDPCVEHAKRAERVALNMCLLLTNYGFKTGPAFPKALEEDRRLMKRGDESGRKASLRVATALHRVEFTQDVIVRRTPAREAGEPTGCTVRPHWVRGHWKMQTWGPRNSLRKKVLIQPYLVHQELVTDRTAMSAAYRDYRQS